METPESSMSASAILVVDGSRWATSMDPCRLQPSIALTLATAMHPMFGATCATSCCLGSDGTTVWQKAPCDSLEQHSRVASLTVLALYPCRPVGSPIPI